MKKVFLGAALMAIAAISQAQNGNVGVGTTTPNINAALDINSNNNKGLLLPRVALTATTNAAPMTQHVQGMHVYNTATANDVTPGEYYNDGTKWLPIATYTPATTIGTIMSGPVTFNNTSDDMNAYQFFPGEQLAIPEKGKYMAIVEHFLAVDYNSPYVAGGANNNGSTLSYYIGVTLNNNSIGAHDSYHFYNIKFTSGQDIFVFDANAGDIIKPYFVSGGNAYTHNLYAGSPWDHIISRNKMTMIRIH